MDKEIKYNSIDSIGMELFRKNNNTFYNSKLSTVMSKIFIAANRECNIEDTDDEYYMKSGSLPNKVYYIYSDKVNKELSDKIFDIVVFNGNLCIWFYSKNAINMIDTDPVRTIIKIYDTLLSTFRKPIEDTFTEKENEIVTYVMTIRLLQFIDDTYGIIDLEKCESELASTYLEQYKYESIKAFIKDVVDNCNNKEYFTNKEYLDSYLLLEKC